MYHISDTYDWCISILSETAIRLALFHTSPLEFARCIVDSLVHDVWSIFVYLTVYLCKSKIVSSADICQLILS